MRTTKRPAPRFTTGQRVEVLRPDFAQPGFPETWQAGTVDKAEWLEDYRLWDVKVRTDGGDWSPQRVGPRGGNRRIRQA